MVALRGAPAAIRPMRPADPEAGTAWLGIGKARPHWSERSSAERV